MLTVEKHVLYHLRHTDYHLRHFQQKHEGLWYECRRYRYQKIIYEVIPLKKTLAFGIAILLLLAASTGCINSDRENTQADNPPIDTNAPSPNTYLPQIKIDGTVYYLEGNENPGIEIAESTYLGEVLSTVPLSQQVTENGQVNFGVEAGTPYAKYGDGIVVRWNDKWVLFVKIAENNT